MWWYGGHVTDLTLESDDVMACCCGFVENHVCRVRKYVTTRETFCRTRSLSNATSSFMITWRSPSSKSAAVYKMSWKSDDFSLQYGESGSRPPSWNCFTTIRDHPRSLCCWPQLPVKFHVNVVHWYEYLNFLHIWLKMAIQAPQIGVLGTLDP